MRFSKAVWSSVFAALGLLLSEKDALAERPYAEPPNGFPDCRDGGSRNADGCEEPPSPPAPILRRAGVRFLLGPSSVTTGAGLGYGILGGLDVGTGSVGGRFSATWTRSERADGTSPTGQGFAQYLAELVLDPRRRGALHPIFAVGVGAATVRSKDETSGAGVGTARVGVEYVFGLDDADVRVGANIFGAMIGPAEPALKDLRGYAGLSLQVSVGFY
ncbi:MAG: hypothetical protein U0174_04550 [Polyangiaceae bacterium]